MCCVIHSPGQITIMSSNQNKQQNNQLTSYDYARLIQFVGQHNHHVKLNKTQINKILFYVYGVYLAKEGTALFENEEPRAWPYGPVFPLVYKKIDPNEIISSFDQELQERFKANNTALYIVVKAVEVLHKKSARTLTDWSHRIGSPWHETVYEETSEGIIRREWNRIIDREKIKAYFSKVANIDLCNL